MGLKAIVAAMFLPVLQTRKKGKYYMLLEYVSQFYRTLVPAPLWVRYLSNPLETGAVFAVLITAVYLMIKGGIIFTSLRDLYRAVLHFLQDQVCPSLPMDMLGPIPDLNVSPLTFCPNELPVLLISPWSVTCQLCSCVTVMPPLTALWETTISRGAGKSQPSMCNLSRRFLKPSSPSLSGMYNTPPSRTRNSTMFLPFFPLHSTYFVRTVYCNGLTGKTPVHFAVQPLATTLPSGEMAPLQHGLRYSNRAVIPFSVIASFLFVS